MKYDLYPILIKKLKELYGLSSETESLLYKYIYVRASIVYDERKVSSQKLFDFVLEELNVDTFREEGGSVSEYLVYKGDKYTVFETRSEFIDNLLFRAEMEGNFSFHEELNNSFKKGYQKAYKYRKEKNYKSYRMYHRLLVLNEIFKAKPMSSPGIEGFQTSPNHNPMRRSKEEELELILLDSVKRISKTTAHITEEDLEDYLVNNISLIEEGLVYLDRQVKVPRGIVDILAKDKDGNICIIEVKINEDKSIVWQVLYYPNEIRKMYKDKNIRVITVAPSYSEPIYEALKSAANVETFSYDVSVTSGNIDNLVVSKC